MNKKQVIEKLESIEKELAVVREYIGQFDDSTAQPGKYRLPLPSDQSLGYTLDDLYNSFGKKKKSLSYRLNAALRQKGITSLEDFLNLSPGEILDLSNVGYETLLQTKKALFRLGIDW